MYVNAVKSFFLTVSVLKSFRPGSVNKGGSVRGKSRGGTVYIWLTWPPSEHNKSFTLTLTAHLFQLFPVPCQLFFDSTLGPARYLERSKVGLCGIVWGLAYFYLYMFRKHKKSWPLIDIISSSSLFASYSFGNKSNYYIYCFIHKVQPIINKI